MLAFIAWYLVLLLLGWASFPITFRLLPFLSDRGYTLSRALGLLVWGYLFWLFASLHVLQNNTGGVVLALLMMIGLGIYLLRGDGWSELREWIKKNKRLILVSEVLFLLMFAFWAYIRAADPDIAGTEKPMELAFINAILASPSFPPQDPWLSGYAISYYYFGYVIVSMLVRVTGVVSGIAFNLTIASWFGLTGLSAFGLVYTLLDKTWNKQQSAQQKKPSAIGGALLAPFFVLIVSNLEGFLEMLHSRGLFWSMGADGQYTSRFWSWLNIKELVDPPAPPFTWIPERLTGIVWWRGSRVLQDLNLQGQTFEIIDEFPFFSYLLGDMHPHLLAMPFAILAAAIALNLYLGGKHKQLGGVSLKRWVQKPFFWLAVIATGGLAFLNTWDFPIYVGLFSAAYTLVRYQQSGWSGQRIWDFIQCGLLVGVSGLLLYLPFYIGFQSQAGGILPSLVFFTRGVHFWIMFAPLLIPILVWLWDEWRKHRKIAGLKTGLLIAGSVVFGLWLLNYLFGLIIFILKTAADIQVANGATGLWATIANLGGLFSGLHGGEGFDVIFGSLARRLASPMTWITLLVMFVLAWTVMAVSRRRHDTETLNPEAIQVTAQEDERSAASGFVVLLVLIGIGLTLFPEFFYLRDQFSNRMNTIFKFYFQAWIVWGIAASYASAVLWTWLKPRWKIAFRAAWVGLMLMAIAYPLFMTHLKTGVLDKPLNSLTLDGTQYVKRYATDDYAAIQWLKQSPQGIVAEAVGGSYSGFARVSMLTGYQTVLGWVGHEYQWRGSTREIGSREPDIQLLYKTNSWDEAKAVLEKYQIRYVYVGSLEESKYRVDHGKFLNNLAIAYQNNTVTIYEVVPSSLEQ